MSCELWVRGTAENGGPVFVDVFVFSNWINGTPYPVLTPTSRTHPSGCIFYTANPSWQYEAAGWHTYPEFYKKNCGQDPPYDCINGVCTLQSTYKTPGLYPTLAACKSACSQVTPCDGECISNAQIAALQQAANQVTSKLCG